MFKSRGSSQEDTFSCLKVTQPEGGIVVQFNYQGHDDWIMCGNVAFPSDDELDAVCGRADTQSHWQSSDLINMHLTVDSYEDDRDLYHRNDL